MPSQPVSNNHPNPAQEERGATTLWITAPLFIRAARGGGRARREMMTANRDYASERRGEIKGTVHYYCIVRLVTLLLHSITLTLL